MLGLNAALSLLSCLLFLFPSGYHVYLKKYILIDGEENDGVREDASSMRRYGCPSYKVNKSERLELYSKLVVAFHLQIRSYPLLFLAVKIHESGDYYFFYLS